MEKRIIFLFSFFFLLFISKLEAQTNVRGWYADGQVWIVWEYETPLPETYAIYAKPTAFTNTADAQLVGRLFKIEYLGAALKEQLDTTFTFRIPDGQGGIYQLMENEALFVATPHQAGALHFAVAPWGETTVTPGVNITSGAVSFQYNPVADPVECHLQAILPSPFAAGYTCLVFNLWADGRQNHWEGRPDFPIMANQAKNGMPSLFMVSVPVGLDTTGGVPATIWLHGGGGIARQSLAGSRAIVGLRPEQGVLVAHNDDLIGYKGINPPNLDQPSWHFGWRKNYNPFTTDNAPTETDTVINYTQRRYIWIDQWLVRRLNVDPNRININGHSMGAAGTTAMAKVYPNHYASATVFNNGFDGPGDDIPSAFGFANQSSPTNLRNRAGETVELREAFNLIDNCSPERDLPLLRSYHGKTDDNGVMRWDANVVENYRIADSLGMGMNLFWSERGHDIGGIGDHWAFGLTPTQQTNLENVAYEEALFRSDVSFPGFFNHRLDPSANDPGDGTQGLSPNGVGDDWGTWGGWHRWDWNSVADQPNAWAVTAWLEDNAVFFNDNCPENALVADLAIRKPQQLQALPGTVFDWVAREVATGNVLQSGSVSVNSEGVLILPGIELFRESIRKVRIFVINQTVATTETQVPFNSMKIFPNPSAAAMASLTLMAQSPMSAIVRATGVGGGGLSFPVFLAEGENHISLADFGALPAGFYWVEIRVGEVKRVVKWVKM